MTRVPAAYSRAALIGTGLIGGSLLLALRRAGLVRSAVGYDLRTDAAVGARGRGIVDELAAHAALAVTGADLVILAVPVGATRAVCQAIAPALEAAPEVLVTDVGSTKARVLAAVAEVLPHPDRFVGAHPLAGTERSGPDAADPDLFVGRTCLLTPTTSTDAGALEACRALWTAVGARVRLVEAARHDELVALVSHLPHAAAFALAAAIGRVASEGPEGELEGLFGGGFVDTTRIAASDPTMWRDIFIANAEPLLAALASLEAEIDHIRRAIGSEDGAALSELILRAREGRKRVMGS